MQNRVPVLLLLCAVSLPACDNPSPGSANDPQPSPTDINDATESDIAPLGSTPYTGGKETAEAVTTHGADIPQHKPLDLSFDHLLTEERQTTAPVTAAEGDRLLPDLFAPQTNDNPLSVEGQLLMEQDAREFADSVDGATVTIEIKTD